MKKFIVDISKNNERLDKALVDLLVDKSRAYISKLIDDGNVLVNDKIAKQKEELLNLRFQLALGQLDNTAQISKIKKSIAVMKTIITEKQNVK